METSRQRKWVSEWKNYMRRRDGAKKKPGRPWKGEWNYYMRRKEGEVMKRGRPSKGVWNYYYRRKEGEVMKRGRPRKGVWNYYYRRKEGEVMKRGRPSKGVWNYHYRRKEGEVMKRGRPSKGVWNYYYRRKAGEVMKRGRPSKAKGTSYSPRKAGEIMRPRGRPGKWKNRVHGGRKDGLEVLDPKRRLWDRVKRIKRLPTSHFGLAQSLMVRSNGPPNRRPSVLAIAKQLTMTDAKTSSVRKEMKGKEDPRKYVDKVILADCLEFVKSLPPEMIDCTITCPPHKTGAIINQDNDSWKEFVSSQIYLLDELYRVTKPGGHLWYVHKVQHHGISTYHPGSWIDESQWVVRQEIVWDKGAQDETVQKFWPRDERIFWLRKEPGPIFGLHWVAFRWGSIWRWSVSPDDKSFPLYLAMAILHATKLPKGSLIFDPYGRTGTTAKASKLTKNHFLTAEIDEANIEAINDRLNKTGIEDKYWSSLIFRKLANRTLDLRDPSMSLRAK